MERVGAGHEVVRSCPQLKLGFQRPSRSLGFAFGSRLEMACLTGYRQTSPTNTADCQLDDESPTGGSWVTKSALAHGYILSKQVQKQLFFAC